MSSNQDPWELSITSILYAAASAVFELLWTFLCRMSASVAWPSASWQVCCGNQELCHVIIEAHSHHVDTPYSYRKVHRTSIVIIVLTLT